MTDYDNVIIGAGCAGLSLAAQLTEADVRQQTLVLDPRTDFGADRTWCFFNVDTHLFSDAVAHRWNRWSVRDHDASVERKSSTIAYEHLPSEAFYERALDRVRRHRPLELGLGTRVRSVVDCGDHVRVDTDAGELRAGKAFDSRPRLPEPHAPHDVHLLQHFVGWFIETSNPCFDPGHVSLMDFRVRQAPGVHFMYVLPFSRTKALVEDTFFSDAPEPIERYEGELRDFIGEHFGEFRITRTERGVLPMSTRHFEPRPSPRVYRLGIGGGMARPATGYAFLAIQRHSRLLAHGLARGELPASPSVRRPRTSLLDRVFLSYLADHPEDGPRLFLMLFRGNSPERVARFLSERSSVADDLRIMHSLPGRKFAPRAVRLMSNMLSQSLGDAARTTP